MKRGGGEKEEMKCERGKFWEALTFAVIFAMLAFLSVGCTSATTHYVNPGESIQAAVNAADPDDTITVRDGIYTENVDVNVDNLTIQSENGTTKTIIKAKDPKHPVFYVGGSYVNIIGFTVTGTTYYITHGGIHIRYDAKYKADHCNIYNNNCSDNQNGIFVYSSNNILFNNNCSKNSYSGIYVWGTNTIYNNNCFENQQHGICIHYSRNGNIYGNNCSNNIGYGVIFSDSDNNHVYNNNCSNNFFGILVDDSINNTFYVNNFKNDIISRNSNNVWNSTAEITYTYKGKTYTNYLGNYWSDYKGCDDNNNGIGDSHYSINSDNDNYPLMEPWENYFAPTENIFDTEQSENPYPSIMGTHNGTITPSSNITVSTLYTYACVGTGGHTESIKLYNENDTLIANGSWNGYIGDYHNITIHNLTGEAPYVTLLKNHEYRYVIKTGSYPQIIHAKSKDVTGGTITCDQFIDANGKTYTDWIPAIRLH